MIWKACSRWACSNSAMTQTAIDHYLESQYNNRAAVADHALWFDRWQSDSEQTRLKGSDEFNLAYGNHPRNRLDILKPAVQAEGIFLFIHGGYWQAMDKSSFSFLAKHVNASAMTLVVINYGLCPEVRLEQIIEHVRAALRWICDHSQTLAQKGAKLIICGHSAGAHLIAELLCTDWEKIDPRLACGFIHKAIAISGLYDLRPLVKTTINHALNLDENQAHQLSPAFRQPLLRCEIELCVGSLESHQYHWQSEHLRDRWKAFMPESELNVYPGHHHFSVLNAVLDRNFPAV